ncbi:arsenate reductase/protein-tyrosine-phosphatase family protein [Nioella nitratireducens]|uniref:arsenate reductase/protein-tyrosine-phosphatase family protein n=1 Tax=Nioella nitratireducens TaxID=1287720 RepID=UPI0008FCEF85|nr:helix-turn-helix domain-containing protein [Nioella nitratireducens]
MEKELDQLATLAHAGRNGVFRLLMRRYPDAVPAGEIAAALDLKASTASAYLASLRESGLIGQARQGTSLRYRAEIGTAQALVGFLFNECCRGRPDLCPPMPLPHANGDTPMADRKYTVLFICTGNSARSIFAESILRDMAGDRFEVFSAGTKPYSELNPFAVEMLQNKGHDTSHLRAKNVSEFQGPDAPALDFVFTVCDQAANEECPVWEGQPLSAHWGMPDPVKATGTEAEQRLAFQLAYGALKNRITLFTALPLDALDRISLQGEIDSIGASNLEGDTA